MKMLTVRDIAALTGLARQTIYQYHSDGRMPEADEFIDERIPRWKEATIRKWLKSR